MDHTDDAIRQSDALVLFGITGDLARKKIFPALYGMAKRGSLNVPVVGVAAPDWTVAQLRRRVTDAIKATGKIEDQAALVSRSVNSRAYCQLSSALPAPLMS